jgi:WD40 repeat protein
MAIIIRKTYTSKNIYIRNIEGNILFKVLVEHEQSITAVAISEDGKHVLTGDKDGQAIIWSFKDGI